MRSIHSLFFIALVTLNSSLASNINTLCLRRENDLFLKCPVPALDDFSGALFPPVMSVLHEPTSTQKAATTKTAHRKDQEPTNRKPLVSFEEWQKKQVLVHENDYSRHNKRKSNAASSSRQQMVDSVDGGFSDDFGSMFEGSPVAMEMPNVQDEIIESTHVKSGHRHKFGGDRVKSLKERFNYASTDCAATVRKANKEAKGANAILYESKDQYLLNKCSADNKFVIINLCEPIRIDTIVMANYEFFSSTFKDFRIYVADRYPAKDWQLLGQWQARNTRDLQVFKVEDKSGWPEYIKIEFLSHYGREYYCPLSLVRVYGMSMMEYYNRVERQGLSDDEDEDTLEDQHLWPADVREQIIQPQFDITNASESMPTVHQSHEDDEDEDEDSLEDVVIPPVVPDLTDILDDASENTGIDEKEDSSAKMTTSPETDDNNMIIINEKTTNIITENIVSSEKLSPPPPPSPPTTTKSTQPIKESPISPSLSSSSSSSIPSKEESSSIASPESENSEDASTQESVSSSPSSKSVAPSSFTSSSSSLSPSSSKSVTSVDDISSTPSSSGDSIASSSSDTTTTTAIANSASTDAAPSFTVRQESEKPPSSTTTEEVRQQTSKIVVPKEKSTTQESIYKTIMKRLNALEVNATLSQRYLDDQNKMLNDVFIDMEKRHQEQLMMLIGHLNETASHKIDSMKRRYEKWYDDLKDQTDNDMREMTAKISILADQLSFERRISLTQLVIMITLFVFMALSRGTFSTLSPVMAAREEERKKRQSAAALLSTISHSLKPKKTPSPPPPIITKPENPRRHSDDPYFTMNLQEKESYEGLRIEPELLSHKLNDVLKQQTEQRVPASETVVLSREEEEEEEEVREGKGEM